MEKVFGETIPEADTRTGALTPGLSALADHLAPWAAQDNPGPVKTLFILPFVSAVSDRWTLSLTNSKSYQ